MANPLDVTKGYRPLGAPRDERVVPIIPTVTPMGAGALLGAAMEHTDPGKPFLEQVASTLLYGSQAEMDKARYQDSSGKSALKEGLEEQSALRRGALTPVEIEAEEAKTRVEQGAEEQKDVQPQIQQSLQDPATTIATERVTGGNPPPEMPTRQQVAAVEQDQRSRQVLFDQTKIPKWHESDAFSTALMSFGLNLLAGNDLATSFAAGSQVFDKSYGKEKREMWADDLRAAGYDDAEIMAYIETGDNKLLTDPMEKEFKRQQFQLGQAQVEKAIYESSPEYQEYLRKKEYWDMGQKQQASDLAERQFQALEAERAARLKLDTEKAQASGAGKPDPKMAMAGMLMAGVNMDALNYLPTNTDYITLAAISKLPEKAQESAMQKYLPEFHAMNQSRNQLSEMIGRLLSGAALSETKERPTWANALVPTEAEIRNGDKEAIARKKAVLNSIMVYADQVNGGKAIGKDVIGLRDVQMLGNGQAQFMVDPQTGIPRGIQYADGRRRLL